MSETILDAAGRLTSGDRNKSYGHPLDDYHCTGALFTALLQHAGKLRQGAVIEPELAQALMIAVKLSRLSANLTHRDSLIDIAGYARTIEMTLHEREVRNATPEQVAAKIPCCGTDDDDLDEHIEVIETPKDR